jgi:pimeloyl-ACP methyl ester carboxylesterase
VRRLALVVAVLLAIPAAAVAAPPRVTTAAVLIRYRAHDGRIRPAWLLLPAGYHGQRVPLVISPHGRGVSARRNTAYWGNLPTEGGFAVVCPSGQGRRLEAYSWGDPGQIADLARMPEIVERHGVHVDLHRVYAFGGSMGGQESLLLAAEYPRVLAGVAAFDPATDMSRRYRDFASLKDGSALRRLARLEIGGTPKTDPLGYARRSPDHYAEQLAFSDVPLQLYWSTRDQIITDQRLETGALAGRIRDLNPHARLWDFRGAWRHTAEMWPDRRMPRALARFGLLPWSKVPPLGGVEVTRGPGLLA